MDTSRQRKELESMVCGLCSSTRGVRAQGFTLIEVMLALAIVATIMSLVWGSFSVTSRAKRRAEAISDRYHQVRLAMNRMAREISMAYLSKNDQVGTTKPRTLFVSVRNSASDDLMFSSLAHMRTGENAKESDQSLIRYYASPDPDDASQLNLMRRESRRLGGRQEAGEEGPAYVMLEGLVSLHFEFFDVTADEWRERWSTRSADGQPDRLPSKVRIVLTVTDEQGKEVEFRTATRIHLLDPIWFT